jgi:diguanylate cyclase (GGDEF)-like protein
VREKLIRLGLIKTVMLISLITVLAALSLYLFIGYFLLKHILYGSVTKEIYIAGIILTILISSIIAPIISWYIIDLLIKIHNLEVEMRYSATYDSLTKVMGRKAFLTNSEVLFQLNKRDNSSLAMLYIDIDDFKKVNDIHGHAIGDEVLKSFGYLSNNNKRDCDLVGRLGGEEFAFILPQTDDKGAIQFADNLRNIIKSHSLIHNNNIIRYTISIGVSIYNGNNQINLDTLIRQSDTALYIAKNSGKNKTILYEVKK